MPIGKNDSVLWLPKMPSDDKEMLKGIPKAIQGLHLYNQALIAGSKQLGQVDEAQQIYLMGHGHEKLPGVKIDGSFWTAPQIAKLLIDDGLKAGHGVLELLVCWAGASIGNAAYVQENMKVRDQWKAGKATGADLQGRFDAMPRPKDFAADSQLIPFAAALMAAFKASAVPKFTKLRIFSYNKPVDMQTFDGGVHVNIPGGGKMRAVKNGAYWRQWL
ncbi:MAG TPA: hypothetical protein VNM14_19950 [Planctomycetota bacterium]|jgi:hypothetical protein|nr:hypothetical protein [Planctomycetota bacterium]